MATATGTDYASPPLGGTPAFSRSSSLSVNPPRSPDTASSIYPERAIRPLPKNRLKSRLSPQQASTIHFPPEPPSAGEAATPLNNIVGESIGGTSNGFGGNVGHTLVGARMTNGGDVGHGHYLHHHPHPNQRQDDPVHDHCTCGEEGDSGDEEVEFDHPDYRYAAPGTTHSHAVSGKGGVGGEDNLHRRLMEAARKPPPPPPPGSSADVADLADGYESFENTSNKKKRKIPLPTASSLHHTQHQLSAEMASMGISGGGGGGSVDGTMDAEGGSVAAAGQQQSARMGAGAINPGGGTGISGAGRGRYGRQNGRSDHGIRRPMGSSSMNPVNGYPPRALPANRSANELKSAADPDIETTNPNTGGIISQAIKSAAEQGPLTAQNGQKDAASLLHTATNSTTAPASTKTQFTFAVESESAIKMVDQQAAAAAHAQLAAYHTPHHQQNARGVDGQPMQAGGGGNSRGMSTQGTQTTPSLRGNGNGASATRAPPPAPSAPPTHQQQQPPPPKPKPRRRPSKEFALAARQRRLQQQEYTNYHHRPTASKGWGLEGSSGSGNNMWICEFCEYEDIFGVPPYALIRQYEIKDRQDRKRAAEKRRLLEKAKAKGRKGKKGGKKGHAGSNAAAPAAAGGTGTGQAPAGPTGGGSGVYDPNLPPPLHGHGHGHGQGDEEFFDDDEEEEEEGSLEYGDEYDPVGGSPEGFEGEEDDEDEDDGEAEYYRRRRARHVASGPEGVGVKAGTSVGAGRGVGHGAGAGAGGKRGG